jgi:hypothetical protein
MKTGYNSLGGGYIGASLLGIPFFILGHICAIVIKAVGVPIDLNGYSFPYRYLVSIGYSMYGFIAYLLMYRLTSKYFLKRNSFFAVLGIMLFSTSSYYMYYDFAFSHTTAMLFTTLYMYLTLRSFSSKKFNDVLLVAVVAGFMLAIRPSNINFIIISLFEIGYTFFKKYKTMNQNIDIKYIYLALLAVAVFLTAYSPQHVAMKYIISGGGFLPNLGGSSSGFPYSWNKPDILNLLFYKPWGLFVATPVTVLSFLGLAYAVKRDYLSGVIMSLPLLVCIYAISCFNYLYGKVGWIAFGSRYFSECALIFVFGLAAFLEFTNDHLIQNLKKIRLLNRISSDVIYYTIILSILVLPILRMPYSDFFSTQGLRGVSVFLFKYYPAFAMTLNRNLLFSLYYCTIPLWITHLFLVAITMILFWCMFILIKRFNPIVRFVKNNVGRFTIIILGLIVAVDLLFIYSDSHSDIVLGVENVTDGRFDLGSNNISHTVDLRGRRELRGIKLLSILAYSGNLPDGTIIGNIEAYSNNNVMFNKEVIIGSDVAEWACHRPDIKDTIKQNDNKIKYIVQDYGLYGSGDKIEQFPIREYIINFDFARRVNIDRIKVNLKRTDIIWTVNNVIGKK